MNPDFAIAAALLALLVACNWRIAFIVFGVGLFVFALHSQLGYW